MGNSPRRALVTGGFGYLGVNLVPRLRELGWTVRTFARSSAPSGPERFEHVRGDVRDRHALDGALDGVDAVFHLASRITLASHDDEALDINVRGAATVARAALDHGVGRVVHVSSVHAFDLTANRRTINETSPRSGPDRPVYDRSKAAGEAAVRELVDAGLDAVIVNPTGIIGPVDPGLSRANAVLRTAARGRLMVAVAGGFDWVDVRDVVEGIVSAEARGRTGQSYLLSGHQETALQIARLAAGLNGRVGPVAALPARLAEALAPAGERVGALWGSDRFTSASIGTLLDDPIVDRSKAETELGYRARPIEDTVRDLVWWLRDRGELGRPPGRWPGAARYRARRHHGHPSR
ncbi:MAG: NAD-dependent epimerase/dehydratase family protein [Acidimicrobiia bacterium]